MAHSEICFYLDENLSPEIAVQLRRHGIDVIRGPLRDKDIQPLQRATVLERVLCTEDEDFNRIVNKMDEYAGVIKGWNQIHSIGDWVIFLRFVHAVCTPDEMRNKVMFLFPVD